MPTAILLLFLDSRSAFHVFTTRDAWLMRGEGFRRQKKGTEVSFCRFGITHRPALTHLGAYVRAKRAASGILSVSSRRSTHEAASCNCS